MTRQRMSSFRPMIVAVQSWCSKQESNVPEGERMRKHSFPLAPIKINYGNHLAAMAIAVVKIVIRDEIGIHWRVFGAAKTSHSPAEPGNENSESWRSARNVKIPLPNFRHTANEVLLTRSKFLNRRVTWRLPSRIRCT